METRETSPDAAKWGLYLSSHIGEAKWTCGPTTNPNAAKCQFFSSRTFDHRRKGAKCASLAFEILSEQYLIWTFTGVTIVLELMQAKAWQELMNPQGWELENHLMMTHRLQQVHHHR
jgi:hypothetical protein